MTLHEQIKAQLNNPVDVGKDYFEKPEVYEKEILTGIKWEIVKYGHKLMDEHAPYKQGQLTTIVGHTNVGKTTLILYLLSRIINDKKLLVYSAENRVSQLARLLIAFSKGNHNYQAYFEWLRSRVLFIRHAKQFTYKDMLEQMSLADDMGFCADCIFIDPYNALKIEKNRNGHEYHYEAIEDMRIFTQQTGKSIFLNCHTVTESQRTKPDKDGEIQPPIMSDVEGGGKFPNKSDDVWVIHRNLYHMDLEERYVSHLYVAKVRNTEGGGKPTGWKEPIKFKFKKDWTGFTNDHDDISSNYKILESRASLIDDNPF